MKFLFSSVAIFALIAQGAAAQSAETQAFGPSYEFIGTYDTGRLNSILTAEYAEFSSFEITYRAAETAVDLYKVKYRTLIPESDNRPVWATGIVAIPQNALKPAPIVSYQHGTVFSKDEVPSQPEKSMETRLAIACFAARGYVVVAADYIGRGDSNEPNSYMVKESTAQACADMLDAARNLLNEKGVETDGLFLSGWSQGSFSTLVLLNRLEKNGVSVNAAAFASTPADLYLCMNKWIHTPSEFDVQWILGAVALLVNSYENYYALAGLADTAFRAEYRQTAKDLYDNKIGWEDAAKVFPQTTIELLEPSFIEGGELVSGRFFKQLQQCFAYNWRFETPTRFYYGDADEVISPYVATLPPAYQKVISGANSEAVYAGKTANHRGAFAFGLKNQQEWFDKILSESKK